MKKYSLKRTMGAILVVTSISAAIAGLSGNNKVPEIHFTSEDLTSNIIFSRQLEEIMATEDIKFNNKELQAIIEKEIGGPITKEALSQIKVLSITDNLTNHDLSDLKYLTNLQALLVFNVNLNIEDIKYNQNLHSVIFNTCIVRNSECLPNSIETLELTNCRSEDKEFIVPYYTKELRSEGSILNNIRLKNPSRLESLYMYTDSVLDLNNLSGCINLKELTLLRLANVFNKEALSLLPSLESVTLDEYAAIWLDNETLDKLPMKKIEKQKISANITILDRMLESILDPNSTVNPETKAKLITLYLLDNFEYDYASVENYEYDRSEVSAYNNEPISTFVEGKKGVCINYAATFTGLANRAGIDTFQLFNQDHTWNAIKTNDGYKGYDLSYLEYGSIVRIEDVNTFVMIKDTTAQDLIRQGDSKYLHFYEFNIDEIVSDNHIADYTPQEIEDKILNIGYINDNSLVRVIEKNQVKLYKMDIFVRSQLILSILTAIMFEISRRNYEKKYKEDNEEHTLHM